MLTAVVTFAVLSWFTSPLLSGMVSIGIFYLIKKVVLQKVSKQSVFLYH